MAINNKVQEYIWIYLILVNVISFLTFFIDKRRSKNRAYRISESFLITISIIGGSLGSILGMKIFHHKTKKTKFSFGLPIIFLFNIGCIYLLLS